MYSKRKHIELLKNFWPIAYDKSYDSKNIHDFYTDIGPTKVKESNYTNIDDQTASDLDLDNVFKEINICMSTSGEQLLYYILRTPKTSKKDLEKRNVIFNKLSEDPDLRANLQFELTGLGILRRGNILSLINTKNKTCKLSLSIYIVLCILMILATIYSFFLGASGFMLFGMAALISQSINLKLSTEYKEELDATEYLRKLLQTGAKISSIKDTNCTELNEILHKIKESYTPLKKLKLYTLFLAPLDWGLLIEFINNIFFTNLISYQLILNKIKLNREDLINLYYYIGQLDAFISIASYRERIGYFCEPKFVDKNKYLKLENAIHPLVIDGVANSIELDSMGVIITGSNMSGKSTFMRTMGLNILLAQSIYTPLCEGYEASIFNIMSSLSISDDVTQGKSYYLGECNAILRILNESNRHITTFCIIDEIFKGTNPIERIAASREILKYLSNNNTITAVATHDLEIAETINDKFIHKYFCENVDEKNGLSFDYEIKDGICHTGNALKLLKHLNYPEIIIKNAVKSISNK